MSVAARLQDTEPEHTRHQAQVVVSVLELAVQVFMFLITQSSIDAAQLHCYIHIGDCTYKCLLSGEGDTKVPREMSASVFVP